MDQLVKCDACSHPAVEHEGGGCTRRCGCALSRDMVLDAACKVADAEYLDRWKRRYNGSHGGI